MPKTATFTTVTPLPAGITRKSVVDMYHDHLAMIDLNPLVVERFNCKPPGYAPTDEYYSKWYSIKGTGSSASLDLSVTMILITTRQGIVPARRTRHRLCILPCLLSRSRRRSANTCLCTSRVEHRGEMDCGWPLTW